MLKPFNFYAHSLATVPTAQLNPSGNAGTGGANTPPNAINPAIMTEDLKGIQAEDGRVIEEN